MKPAIVLLAAATSLSVLPLFAQQGPKAGADSKAGSGVNAGSTASAAGAGSAAKTGGKSSSDINMEILRQKLKADKKLLVADNMDLDDAEAKGFWPVYEAYQSELQKLNQRIKTFVDAYVRAQARAPVSDEAARKMVSDYLSIEARELELKSSYVPKLELVLPAYKVARYLQLENKVRAVARYELAADLPLVE